jgi:intracellular sulfur oxidation DsrE/DsrF family protein
MAGERKREASMHGEQQDRREKGADVCGQWLRYKNIEESRVVSDVQIASDALIVLVVYQNRGYAHLIY